VLDRRGEGSVAVLVDLVASGSPVLALVADVPRRLAGLAERTGGFALASYAGLARSPELADGYAHVVALDPPGHPDEAALLDVGPLASFTHLTWGAAELRFSQQIQESEHGLRAALVPLYRARRERGTAVGEELEALLRGDGIHGRSVALAARLVAVLEELGLVSLDRDLPALTVVDAERTALERSATYRTTMQRHEDGRRWLTAQATANPLPIPA